MVAKHVTGVLFLDNSAWTIGLLLELHALTLAACSYALLQTVNRISSTRYQKLEARMARGSKLHTNELNC